MPGKGRIRDSDVATVRSRVRIEQLVGEYVQLRRGGADAMKGLCPFHDEKSPSFQVSPSRGYFHCFGCGEGGDAIDFIRKLEHLSFSEAVEHLANKVGVTLVYEGGGSSRTDDGRSRRARLVEATAAAQAFFVAQLATPEAQLGRDLLTERGFDPAAATHFGCGYAPDSWDSLLNHLRGKGFNDAELKETGLCRPSSRGTLIDVFRARLMWPIRDLSGDVVGFGARKLLAEEQGGKYINTAETALYKKSQLLYGVDLAKREIVKSHQAVIVEGYTDVMACHLAGVKTAVATCGTAFGEEHVKVLRRLLLDDDDLSGEVVFVFDGDEAGQKAALKASELAHGFASRTFVAVLPDKLDPCDLRQQRGDAALRDALARRVPLFEFVLRDVLAKEDLETAEGRVRGTAAGVKVVSGIKDPSLRAEYTRRLAGWVGAEDPAALLAAVNQGAAPVRAAAPGAAPATGAQSVEREVLKIALQRPAHAGLVLDSLDPACFTTEPHRVVFGAVLEAGGTEAGALLPPDVWVEMLRDLMPHDAGRGFLTALVVEPAPADLEDQSVEARWCSEMIGRLEEMHLGRLITEVKGGLQRMSPLGDTADRYNRLFGDLIALESRRRAIRDKLAG